MKHHELTSYCDQHIQSGLLQHFDLLFYDVLKCLIVHKSWQLSATILIFKFPDLPTDSFVTYGGKSSALFYENNLAAFSKHKTILDFLKAQSSKGKHQIWFSNQNILRD